MKQQVYIRPEPLGDEYFGDVNRLFKIKFPRGMGPRAARLLLYDIERGFDIEADQSAVVLFRTRSRRFLFAILRDDTKNCVKTRIAFYCTNGKSWAYLRPLDIARPSYEVFFRPGEEFVYSSVMLKPISPVLPLMNATDAALGKYAERRTASKILKKLLAMGMSPFTGGSDSHTRSR